MEEKNTSIEILNEDVMLERGKFVANGHTFLVHPVYLGEENEFFSDMAFSENGIFSPIPNAEEGVDKLTDAELGQWAIALFSEQLNGQKEEKKKKFFSKILNKIFRRKDYHYYADVPVVQQLIKWIERKVTYNGKKIKFYNLERLYHLSKADVERMFIYLYQISFFPVG